jgi:hypothetical protein
VRVRSAAAPRQPSPGRSVFINCPFDKAYEPLLRAIVLGSVACGFVPRSALETGSVAEPRLDRILAALFSANYSIHDLSRCRGEGDEGLARFNMPLELGMAMARRHGEKAGHDWLVLVPEGHAYARFVSDLAGIDPKHHDGTPRSILLRVMSWLATHADGPVPSSLPPRIVELLLKFDRAWDESVRAWGELRWWSMVERAQELVAVLGDDPHPAPPRKGASGRQGQKTANTPSVRATPRPRRTRRGR